MYNKAGSEIFRADEYYTALQGTNDGDRIMVTKYEAFSSAVADLTRHLRRIEAKEMAKYGLKGSHAVYLMVIDRYPDGITSATLSELTGRDKADVSRAISMMEKKGLVVRDGRSSYRAPIFLTEEGQESASELFEKTHFTTELVERGISAEELDAFNLTLAKLVNNMQRINKGGLD